jgi:hypothetical protein
MRQKVTGGQTDTETESDIISVATKLGEGHTDKKQGDLTSLKTLENLGGVLIDM